MMIYEMVSMTLKVRRKNYFLNDCKCGKILSLKFMQLNEYDKFRLNLIHQLLNCLEIYI